MFFRAILPATHRAIVSNAHLHPQAFEPQQAGAGEGYGAQESCGKRDQVKFRNSDFLEKDFSHSQEVGVILTEINFCPTS